jgi:hypothetical protein
MTKKIVFGVAAVALATVVMAPAASAACASARSAKTYNSGTGAYSYWHAPSGDTGGTLVGQTWQLGAPGTWSTGNCNSVDVGSPGGAGFIYFGAGGIGLNLDLAACGSGCPASGSTLAVVAQKKSGATTDFLVATVVETPGGAVNFDYSTQGNHEMIPMPRPRVTSSSRAGTTVNLNVQVPAISAGLYGPNAANAVTGFNILSASSATNPGRDAAAYTLRSAITSPGGNAATGAVSVDCTNPNADQWVVTQLVLEGGVGSSAVSEATRVNCNPALADPKYKIVPKRGTPKQGVGTSN